MWTSTFALIMWSTCEKLWMDLIAGKNKTDKMKAEKRNTEYVQILTMKWQKNWCSNVFYIDLKIH